MLLLTVALIFTANVVEGKNTTCAESQKLFADLCFSPTPTDKFDVKWTLENQPDGGWYSDLANDVAALHTSEIVKGELLEPQENYDDLCWRVKIQVGDEDKGRNEGSYLGYKNLFSNFTCDASKDTLGVLRCDMQSSGLSKYRENVNVYFSYADNVNLHILIMCFPNGQVGWHSVSKTSELSEEERKITEEHVTSLGFPPDTTVKTFNKDCPKYIADSSLPFKK